MEEIAEEHSGIRKFVQGSCDKNITKNGSKRVILSSNPDPDADWKDAFAVWKESSQVTCRLDRKAKKPKIVSTQDEHLIADLQQSIPVFIGLK